MRTANGYRMSMVWLAVVVGIVASGSAVADFTFGTPTNLGPPVNTSGHQCEPCISADGLELYFVTKRSGDWQLCVSTRSTKDDEWGPPVALQGIPRVGVASTSTSADGLELYFETYRMAGGWYEIYVMKRATTNDPWGVAVRLEPNVNSSTNDMQPCISADGLALFYWHGGLWMARRATSAGPWGPGEALDSTNMFPSSDWDYGPSISSDGSILYFESDRPHGHGGSDLWQVSIVPVLDFNGDSVVEIEDLLVLIENWGMDETLCDIGPMPWGDGVVDEADLEVLMNYWGQEAYDRTLLAHWKLDETDGATARDSAIGSDGVVSGDPAWEPAGGQVDGTLRFDGIDDYIGTPFVLDPGDGPFSIYAWIKGGAPGQVIVSQADGVSWLLADPAGGNLATSLSKPPGGRSASTSLVSESIVTDGDWHHVGLVWDGSIRTLYVDDVLVTEDSQPSVADSTGGLTIGCGADLEPDSFFSGLIDDVRIYNRAVRP